MDAKPVQQAASSEEQRNVFFYGEPQRLKCLNFLLHLAPYSNETLLILGAIGSGKSVIVKQFVQKGSDTWRVCMIAGETLASLGDFLRVIESRYSIRSLEDNTRTEQIEVLVEEFQALQKRNQRVILIIDDADKASVDVITFLDQLQEGFRRVGDGISLVLSGEASFGSTPEIESLRNHGMHVFDLAPLDFEETQNYVRTFLRKSGMPTETLSSGEIKRIFKESAGNFALTFVQTRNAVGKGRHRLLEREQSGDETATENDEYVPSAVPRSRYFVPLTVLLVFALVAVVQFGDFPYKDRLTAMISPANDDVAMIETSPPPIEPLPDASVEQPPEISSIDDQAALAMDDFAHDSGNEDGGEEVVAAHALEDEFAPPAQPGPPEILTDIFDQIVRDGAGPAPEIASGPEVQSAENHPAASAPADEPKTLSAASEQPKEAISLKEPTSLEPEPVPAAEVDDKPSTPAAGALQRPAALGSEMSEEPATTLPGPAEKAPQDISEIESPSPSVAGPRDEVWLLAQPEAKYTLQIMALGSDKPYEKLLAKVPAPEAFAVYRLVRGNKTLYALVFGVYDSAAEANAAGAQLPTGLGKVSPLPKRLRDIHRDIRAAQ